MNKQQPSLLLCLVMDAVGYTTYAVPFLGEFADVLWAPVSAVIFYRTFGGLKVTFGSLFNFAEELLPWTDFVPSFTLMWVWNYFNRKKAIETPIKAT